MHINAHQSKGQTREQDDNLWERKEKKNPVSTLKNMSRKTLNWRKTSMLIQKKEDKFK